MNPLAATATATVPGEADPRLADPGDRAVAAVLRAVFAAEPPIHQARDSEAWEALCAFLRGGPPPPAAGRRRPAPRLSWPRPAGRGPLLVPGWGAWAGPLAGRLGARARPAPVVAVVDDVPVAAAWPEYTPPAFVARLPGAAAAMARHAAVVAVSGEGAEARVRALLAGPGHRPRADGPLPAIVVVPRPSVLSLPGPAAQPPDGAVLPYCVACGPIESRANTLLLLQLWRSLVRDGPVPPRLVLAGARGTDVEDIRPLLDWNDGLRAVVAEAPGLGPGHLRALLRGACALLAPDFTGADAALLREAAAWGVPVVVADPVAAHALSGPTLLSPLDGPGWRAAVLGAARHVPTPIPAAAPAGAAAYRSELLRLAAEAPAF